MFDYLLNRPRATNTLAIAWNGFFILYSLFFMLYNTVMDRPWMIAFHACFGSIFTMFFVSALKFRRDYLNHKG